jgi:hypothetical protein
MSNTYFTIRFLEEDIEYGCTPTITVCSEFALDDRSYIYISTDNDHNDCNDYRSTTPLKSFDMDAFTQWTKLIFENHKLDLVDDMIGKTYIFRSVDSEEDEYEDE